MDQSNAPVISRREARRRDRRQMILAVAGESFLKNGYAATTMSSIAAALGGSKATLWNYFPSKEELFAAVLDDATTAYRAQLSEILDPCGDIETTLERFARSFLEKVVSPEAIALYRLVISEAGRFPEMGAVFCEHAPRHTRTLLTDFLAGAMERGQLRRTDAALAAHTLLTLLMSGGRQLLLLGQMDRLSNELIEKDIAFGLDCFMRIYATES